MSAFRASQLECHRSPLELHRLLEQCSTWRRDHAIVYNTSMATTCSDQQHDDHWTHDNASVYTTRMATMRSVLIMPSTHAKGLASTAKKKPTQTLARALLDPTVSETIALTGPQA